MRLSISEYEIINDIHEESLIGYSDNIIRLYKDYIKQMIDDINCGEMVEDFMCPIQSIMRFLEELYSDSKKWSLPQLIKVSCDEYTNRYDYVVLVEEE